MAVVYPPITEDKAETWLQDHNPVWLWGMDGTLTFTNPLALWLWELIVLTDTKLPIQDLFDINVFDVFKHNFSRIPVGENRDFFTMQSQRIKRLLRTSGKNPPAAYASFEAAMRANPLREEIYDHATDEAEKWEQYTLKIAPPQERDLDNLLEFLIIVSEVSQNEQAVGYIEQYKPVGNDTIIARKYEEVSKQYGIIPYLHSGKRKEDPLCQEPQIGKEARR
jgi:hypothetical protein